MADAVEAFSGAVKLADLWLARFALGVAYVQADHYAEGLRELEACQNRRGEASAVFLDDVPTFRYLAVLPYWLARAQEGAGQKPAAAENYKKFLSLRPTTPKDSARRGCRPAAWNAVSRHPSRAAAITVRRARADRSRSSDPEWSSRMSG